MKTIGLVEVENRLKQLKKHAEKYTRGNISLPNYIINLPKENGQTFVTGYITDFLMENKLRDFLGMDCYLEYTFDGTLYGLQDVFSNIRSTAVYMNEYHGVISMDITTLADHVNEYQVEYFLENLKKVEETATIIIYYNDNKGKKTTNLINRIKRTIKCENIEVSPYTSKDLSRIICSYIEENGTDILDKKSSVEKVVNLVDKHNITTAKQAIIIAKEFLSYASYNDETTYLDLKHACCQVSSRLHEERGCVL